jgi:formylglycine-generating enzyme
LMITSCGSPQTAQFVSDKTGWNFNDPKLGGFDVATWNGQITAPGLSFVEGGRFTMGQQEEDLMEENNNMPHTVSVPSFYMDQTEVANIHYREYEYWLSRVYGADYPQILQNALPDTMCWRRALQYNEPMVNLYYRHAGYNYYPVVGVNWKQATDYAKWRSNRVNELMLIKLGYLKKNPNQVADDVFDLKSYLAGQYEGAVGVKKRDLNPTGGGRRNLSYADGVFLPDYRLPTEAEWEFAALAYIGQNPEPSGKRKRGEEVVLNQQTYPWGDVNSTREGTNNAYQGLQLANFQRGRGDAAGVAGSLNDNSFRPNLITAYKPNSYGLYNMAGNVSEWVMDVYRGEMPDEGINPFRGNVFDKAKTLEDGSSDEKDSIGGMPRVLISQEDIAARNVDYRKADVSDIYDGDTTETDERRSVYVSQEDPENRARDLNSLVSNNVRVIKGGSFADRAYWLSPGTRRMYKETHASSTIGFRCVMDKIGGPTIGQPAGNFFSGGVR